MNRKHFENFDTFDKLFGVIKLAAQENVDEIVVKYDPVYGYPTNISIDADIEGINDEAGYTISDFEIR